MSELDRQTFFPRRAVGLAPMEGVTDFPARLWFYLVGGADFFWTPFLRLSATFPKYELPVEWCPELLVPELAQALPYPCIPQFMTPEPAYFVDAATKILKHAPFVDLNCGCPAPKAVGKGAGSSILKDPSRFDQALDDISSALGTGKFSIKMRTGYSDASAFDTLLSIIDAHELHHLTIHGRTRNQGYTGHADWTLIHRATRRLHIPVIGSGDLVDLQSFQARATTDNCLAATIIGRGALRNPWVFSELTLGQSPEIPLDLVPHLLGAFAMLNNCYLEHFSQLMSELSSMEVSSIGPNIEGWQEFCIRLAESVLGQTYQSEGAVVDRRSLGRLKLLWGYMRTSFPDSFFFPPIMRAKSLPEFLLILRQLICHHKLTTGESSYRPQINTTHDWMFSGERRLGSEAASH